MTPEAKKMIRVIVLRILCCFDLSHVLYFSKGPCCSLACGHRRISGRRFPSPKWVQRCDDRKYVCEHRLAVHKRHNFCSNSNSLATFITCNHFLRLGDSIQSAPRASLHFQILLSSLFKTWYFSNFSSEILVPTGLAISVRFACLPLHRQICLNLINRDNQRRFSPKCTFWAIQSTFRSKNSLSWGTQIRKMKLKKIVGNLLDMLQKLCMNGTVI